MSRTIVRSVHLLAVIATAVLLCLPVAGQRAGKAEDVTIYRDDFGVPHIYATTEEGAVFGMGYAQAQDRLEELLKQYRRCTGTMAEAFGPEFFRDDVRQRLWQHAAVAQANYARLSPKMRSIIEAYQAGIRQYLREHPAEVPAWAPELHPWQVIALSRFIIWGWPEGDAGRDLQNAGIKPDPIPYRGSNQWTIAPNRTVDGFALACIDPHLSWYGPFRFYEARLYGGALQQSGAAIPGLPMASLGHNSFCSVAMTTGGPDSADVYEEEVNPANPRQYNYDGQWRDMTVRTELIRVKEGDKLSERRVEFEATHHGPVVARKEGKAYAMKLPYANEYLLPEQQYAMATARNLHDVKKALAMFQLMEQNVMIATVAGDIFYVRNGRVPVRPAGYDWTRPVPGNTSKTEWRGIHKLDDLLQLHNPPQGYMQNCNVSPEHMMKGCPLTPARYRERPYLYNEDFPLHQRAAMTLEELHGNTRVSVQNARDMALSTAVYNADLWQARLAMAVKKSGPNTESEGNAHRLRDLILRWDRRADADSVGAVAYRYWKDQFGEKVRQSDRAGRTPPAEVTDKQLLAALTAGADMLLKQWGRLEVKYGEVYRVGRAGTGRTWPVSGGSVLGLATPRAISFDPEKDGKTFLGRGGQTSTQLVQLSKPPRSWTMFPLGQSDRPDSNHYDDQAEKLFAKGIMKPTYFLQKEELLKHVTATKALRLVVP